MPPAFLFLLCIPVLAVAALADAYRPGALELVLAAVIGGFAAVGAVFKWLDGRTRLQVEALTAKVNLLEKQVDQLREELHTAELGHSIERGKKHAIAGELQLAVATMALAVGGQGLKAIQDYLDQWERRLNPEKEGTPPLGT